MHLVRHPQLTGKCIDILNTSEIAGNDRHGKAFLDAPLAVQVSHRFGQLLEFFPVIRISQLLSRDIGEISVDLFIRFLLGISEKLLDSAIGSFKFSRRLMNTAHVLFQVCLQFGRVLT